MSSISQKSHVRRRPAARQRLQARRAYLILLPFFIYIALWNLIPLIYGMYLGFTEYNALGSRPKWIGLDNFRTFFSVPDYGQLLFRQIWMGMLALFFNTIISFVLALALKVTYRS